jgi:putative transcriptional regulator
VLADRIGITPPNLAVLKNGRAQAIRFTTLEALCDVLDCQPGDLLRLEATVRPRLSLPATAATARSKPKGRYREPAPTSPGGGLASTDNGAYVALLS